MDHAATRSLNGAAILRKVHFRGPIKRGELSAQLSIRKTSVSSIVAELIDLGLLRQVSPTSGRSPVKLDNERFYVSVGGISGSSLSGARVYLDGRVEDHQCKRLDAEATPAKSLTTLAGMLRSHRSAPGTCIGTGVASCGHVDPVLGQVKYAANLYGWRGVPVTDTLSAKLNSPVRLANDVVCQLWSTAWFGGLLESLKSFLYLSITGGIGSSLVIDGKRVSGKQSTAGEIGHVTAGNEGRICGCGKADCLETYCSIPAICGEILRVRPEAGSPKTASDVLAAALNDPAAMNVVARVVRRLSGTIAPAVAAIAPDSLVLGSDDPGFCELVRPMMETHLAGELTCLEPRTPQIHIAERADLGTLKGVAALIIDNWFNTGPANATSRGRKRSRGATVRAD